MLKEIKNKALKKIDVKVIEELEEREIPRTDMIMVNLKNNTYVNGRTLLKGANYITNEEYKLVERFL